MNDHLKRLAQTLDGELFFDITMRTLYATDASAYREMPLAVAIPKTIDDIKKLIAFASANHTSIIPRTAGTSLAGQVVGNVIIVDVSKNFTQIIELNKEEGWVRVEPGVIRDELNLFLKPYGLFFGPETYTANRAMIGGMVGNNPPSFQGEGRETAARSSRSRSPGRRRFDRCLKSAGPHRAGCCGARPSRGPRP